MTARRIFRFVRWTMQDDPKAPPGEQWAACLLCPATSEAARSVEPLDYWARRHAAGTGHLQFRYASITYQRAVIDGGVPAGSAG